MKSRIRSVQKLFWAVLLVGTSVDVRGVGSAPNGMITRSMATDRNRVMETTVMDATCDMNPIPMQEPLSTLEAGSKLLDAAKRGDLDEVKFLTGNGREHKPDPKYVGDALQHAAQEGHADVCTALISGPVKPSAEWVGRALRCAVVERHVDACKVLSSRDCPIQPSAEYVGFSLEFAARMGYVEECEILISSGILISSEWVGRALKSAAGGGHVNVCKALISGRVRLTAEQVGDALQHAVVERHVGTCKYLISGRVRPSAEYVGFSLEFAARMGYVEECKILLSSRILRSSEWVGRALKSAAGGGHVNVCEYLLSLGLGRRLVKPSLQDVVRALESAARVGNVNVCDYFLSDNCPFRLTAEHVGRALETADVNVCEYFLSDNCPLKPSPQHMARALESAVMGNRPDVCKVLVKSDRWGQLSKKNWKDTMKKVEDAMISVMRRVYGIETAGNTIKALIENTTGELHKWVILKLNDHIESTGGAVGKVLESYLDNNNLPDNSVVKLMNHFQCEQRDPAVVTLLLNRRLDEKNGISEELVRRLIPPQAPKNDDGSTMNVHSTMTPKQRADFVNSRFTNQKLAGSARHPGIQLKGGQSRDHPVLYTIINKLVPGVMVKDTEIIDNCKKREEKQNSKKKKLDGKIFHMDTMTGNLQIRENTDMDTIHMDTMTGNPQIRENTDMDTIHMDTMTGNLQKRQKTDHEGN
jgi:hypothetical protein